MIELFRYETDSEFLNEFGDNKVLVPDTITDKGIDIPQGILDQSIFGPVIDYTCRCKELSGIIYEGVECTKCKVVVASRRLRLSEYGYADLNIDLINPLFEDIFITKILRITKKTSERFYESNEVFFTEDSKGSLKVVIDNKELVGKITFNSGLHSLGFGIESIKNLMDIYVKDFKVHKYFDTRRELYDYLVTNPTTNILRIIPAGHREIHSVGKMKVVDTLNIAYKSIISSAKRIEFYKESDNYYLNSKFWFEVSRLRSEMTALYVGGGLSFKGTPIKSYPKILNRKSGLIRGQMLGKRSSFSARTVNSSVDPSKIDISNDEILVPYYMAKNILRVHILRELVNSMRINYEQSMEYVDNDHDLVVSILNSMDGIYNIYTSRAPALFKFSFMSFRMRINFDKDDKTLKIHPLQNSMFNLDYDKKYA